MSYYSDFCERLELLEADMINAFLSLTRNQEITLPPDQQVSVETLTSEDTPVKLDSGLMGVSLLSTTVRVVGVGRHNKLQLSTGATIEFEALTFHEMNDVINVLEQL